MQINWQCTQKYHVYGTANGNKERKCHAGIYERFGHHGRKPFDPPDRIVHDRDQGGQDIPSLMLVVHRVRIPDHDHEWQERAQEHVQVEKNLFPVLSAKLFVKDPRHEPAQYADPEKQLVREVGPIISTNAEGSKHCDKTVVQALEELILMKHLVYADSLCLIGV